MLQFYISNYFELRLYVNWYDLDYSLIVSFLGYKNDVVEVVF